MLIKSIRFTVGNYLTCNTVLGAHHLFPTVLWHLSCHNNRNLTNIDPISFIYKPIWLVALLLSYFWCLTIGFVYFRLSIRSFIFACLSACLSVNVFFPLLSSLSIVMHFKQSSFDSICLSFYLYFWFRIC